LIVCLCGCQPTTQDTPVITASKTIAAATSDEGREKVDEGAGPVDAGRAGGRLDRVV
jgi:hypothetical protein